MLTVFSIKTRLWLIHISYSSASPSVLLTNVIAPSNPERNKCCSNEIRSSLLLEGVHIFYQQYNTGQTLLLFRRHQLTLVSNPVYFVLNIIIFNSSAGIHFVKTFNYRWFGVENPQNSYVYSNNNLIYCHNKLILI